MNSAIDGREHCDHGLGPWRKRIRAQPKLTVFSLGELKSLDEDNVGDELKLGFYIDLEELLMLSKSKQFFKTLKSLEIAPEYDDAGWSPSLVLGHPELNLPELEHLSIRNHAVTTVLFNETNFPKLRSFQISHPLGRGIDTFQVLCPNTLESIDLEFLSVRDGQGLSLSLSPSVNRNLKRVRKYATTIYFAGMV